VKTLRQAHRTAWLALKLCTHGEIAYSHYHRRFGAAEATFYRDLALLRQIGVQIESKRDHGRVRFIRAAL
jgi:predicted DNA-binding transcriptional regulator YafY